MGKKKGKKGKNKTFGQFSGVELLNKKTKLEKSLEETFNEFFEYVIYSEKIFVLEDEGKFASLEGFYKKNYNTAERLNEHLTNGSGIDLSKYDKMYSELLDIVDSRNKKYIDNITSDIRDELSERELRKRDGTGMPEVKLDIMVVKDPGR